MELGLTIYESGTSTVMTVVGEIDLATAPQLQQAFDDLASPSPTVVLDLTQVTFLDSTGVGVLINGRRRLGNDGSLRIVSTQSSIIKLFALTGLTDVLPIFPTLQDALA